jgi:predicted RNA binding protein YcfA (HicA-like mRNA interferase family)
MPDLPAISGKEAIRAFRKAGFVEDRVRGSHHILKRAGHRFNLSVPNHKTLKEGTLRSLIRAAGMTEQEFIDLL